MAAEIWPRPNLNRLPDFKAHVPFFQRLALNLEILSHALQSLLIGYGI